MDSQFKVLHRILHVSGERQKVLSSNVANSDTPGYKAKDVKFGNLMKDEMNVMRTDPKHIGRSDAVKGSNIVVEENPSWGDGNNVELDTEVAKMTENSVVHEAAIKLLSTKIKMFRSAIRLSGR